MFNDPTDGLFRAPTFASHKDKNTHAFCRPKELMLWSAPGPMYFVGIFYRMGFVGGEEQPAEEFDWSTLKTYQNPNHGVKEFYYQAPRVEGELDRVLSSIRRHFFRQADGRVPAHTWKQGEKMIRALIQQPIRRQVDDTEVLFRNVVHKRHYILGADGLYRENGCKLYYELSIDNGTYDEGVVDAPFDPNADYINYLIGLISQG